MFQVVIFSKDSQATMLWFRTKERAELAYKNIDSVEFPEQPDDFGAMLLIPRDNISHVVFNDLSKQAELYKLLEGIGYAKKN